MNRTYFQFIWTILCWGPLILFLLLTERDKRSKKDG